MDLNITHPLVVANAGAQGLHDGSKRYIGTIERVGFTRGKDDINRAAVAFDRNTPIGVPQPIHDSRNQWPHWGKNVSARFECADVALDRAAVEQNRHGCR